MDRLLTMRVFQSVADEGGFSAAARKLDMSVPTVTRLVADLEQHLGTRLMQRTTRTVSLTGAGEAFLERSMEHVVSKMRARGCDDEPWPADRSLPGVDAWKSRKDRRR